MTEADGASSSSTSQRSMRVGTTAASVHDVARAVGKASVTRHHRVAYGDRNRVPIRREHFGHEEWIAAGDIIQTVRRPAGFAGQRVDSLRRQGGQVQASHIGHRKVTENDAERMRGADLVVAIGYHE